MKRLFSIFFLSIIFIGTYMCSPAELDASKPSVNNGNGNNTSTQKQSQKTGDPKKLWQDPDNILPAGLKEDYEKAHQADSSLKVEEFILTKLSEDIINDKDGIRGKLKKLLNDAGYDDKIMDTIIKDSMIVNLITSPSTSVGAKADNKICNITLPPKLIDPDNPKSLEDLHKDFTKLIEDNLDANKQLFANTPEFIEELLKNLDPVFDEALVKKLEDIKEKQKPLIETIKIIKSDKDYFEKDITDELKKLEDPKKLDKWITENIKGKSSDLLDQISYDHFKNMLDEMKKNKDSFKDSIDAIETHLSRVDVIKQSKDTFMDNAKSLFASEADAKDCFNELLKYVGENQVLDIDNITDMKKNDGSLYLKTGMIEDDLAELITNMIKAQFLKYGDINYAQINSFTDKLKGTLKNKVKAKVNEFNAINDDNKVKTIFNTIGFIFKRKLSSVEDLCYAIIANTEFVATGNLNGLKTAVATLDDKYEITKPDNTKVKVKEYVNKYIEKVIAYRAELDTVTQKTIIDNPSGIKNIGNSCYMNSAMNLLSHANFSEPYAFEHKAGIIKQKAEMNMILCNNNNANKTLSFSANQKYPEEEKITDDTIEHSKKISVAITNEIEQLRSSTTTVDSSIPTALRTALVNTKLWPPSGSDGNPQSPTAQYDSSEYINTLLAWTHADVFNSIVEEEIEIRPGVKTKTINKRKNIILKITPKKDLNDSIKDFLSKDVPTNKVRVAEKNFFRFKDTKNTNKIISAPNQYIFTLDRVDILGNKDSSNVNIHEEIEINGTKYLLNSVSIHNGVPGGGHYWAYGKVPSTGKWFRRDDSSSTMVPHSPFQDLSTIADQGEKQKTQEALSEIQSGYVFMYIKKP